MTLNSTNMAGFTQSNLSFDADRIFVNWQGLSYTQATFVSIDLAGVDDWSAGRFGSDHGPRLESALAGRDPDRSLVLLAHQPRGVGEAVSAGVELQISGHTHGGQIVPFNLLVRAAYPYVKGLHRHEEGGRSGQIFVSRGTGYWGPPLRLGAPPEIAKIVLTS